MPVSLTMGVWVVLALIALLVLGVFTACVAGAIAWSRRLGSMFVPLAGIGVVGIGGITGGIALWVGAIVLRQPAGGQGDLDPLFATITLLGVIDGMACPFVVATLALWLLGALAQSSRA